MTGTPNILVVDDEPEVRKLACRALSARGFECDEAGNGEDALRRVQEKAFDVVITDLRMPMRHGHALCNDLLGMPQPPQVMVLTGLSDTRLVRDLMSRGVRDVVQKPVPYDVLAMKVANLLTPAAAQPPQATQPPQAAQPSQRDPRPKKVPKFGLIESIETTLKELTELFEGRLDDVFVNSHDLPEPPRAVRECIRRLAENEAVGGHDADHAPDVNQRESDRITCYTTVTAAPIDRKWRPTGEPFQLALRDMSESGLRLLHTRAINSEFLALKWNATRLPHVQIRVVAQVTRVKPCSPFYDIGCQFVLSD